MTDNAKHTDNRPSTFSSAPSSATTATEAKLQDFATVQVLPNGTSILIRAVRQDDKERLRAAFGELERASIYTRFFGYKKELTEAELKQATHVDFDRVVALWSTIHTGGAEVIIGGGRYVRCGESASRPGAEVAFAVEEDYHGQGIASCLLRQLVRIARSKGLVQFEADVLPTNRAMLAVFARSGLPMQQQNARDVTHITLSLEEDEA
jgi:RimJ/RimL family protein N-acetyltransferase